MNTVQSFLNQQSGAVKWKNYDTAINRLSCRREEEFKWIFPDLAWEGVIDTPIFACKFAQVQGYEHILALANEDGKIAIYNTETKGPRLGGGAHNNAIFDLAWMPKKMKLVSASGDHTAALFDVENGEIELEQVFQGHTRSLKTVACRVDDYSVFATGARDGKIIIWDSRVTKSDVLYCAPDICLPYTHHHPSQIKKIRSKNGKMQPVVSGSSSVTGLVYQDYYTLISCGAGDGLIKVWDMRKNYYISDRIAIPKCTLPYAGSTLRNGFSNLLLNSNGTKLYASCLDNTIYCYNVATYNPKPIMRYVGHKNSTFYVKSSLSSDENYLLSGSSDNNAYIWNTAHPEPIVKLEGHEAEVTCVAWCTKNTDSMLVTCSDDLRHKIWRIGPEIVPSSSEMEYSSQAVVLERKHSYNKTPKSRKRIYETDENLHPYETSRINADKFRPEGYRCAHPDCRKTYLDEYLMIFRNRDMVKSEARKSKKMRLEAKRKRLYLNTLDQNLPSTSESCFNDDEADTVILRKRTRLDSDHNSNDNDSPTSNLPNFVADGSAPHLNSSPVKKKEKDWLTKLRMERQSTATVQELSQPSSPKVRKADGKSPLPKTTSKPADGSSSSSQSPLLKFFKVTNSTGQQYRAKSPNLLSSSPKSQSSSQSSKEI